MTNDERFEVLWTCHHRQIDENRAVSKHMDEIRENITDLQERMNQVCNFLHKIEDKGETNLVDKYCKTVHFLGKMTVWMGAISSMALKSGGAHVEEDNINLINREVHDFINSTIYGFKNGEV